MNTDGAASCPPDWKELYQLAVLELDSAKLPQRITEARNSILKRVAVTRTKHWDREHQELNDALNGLRAVEYECETAREVSVEKDQEKTTEQAKQLIEQFHEEKRRKEPRSASDAV